MNKDIVMIAPTMNTINKYATDRFTYIAKLLVKEGANVELITSDFNHREKKYRTSDGLNDFPFTITLLHEKAYKKNISFARIIGHAKFAKNVIKYLKARKKPDIIYLAIPSPENAYRVAKFCKKNAVPYLIDIQDLWPEAFSIVLGNNFLSKMVINFLKRKPNFAYKNAKYVFSVSNTYTNRALEVNKTCTKSSFLFLGNDLMPERDVSEYDYLFDGKSFNVVYIGNFGNNYDFNNLFKALALLKEQGINDIRLILIGDGNKQEHINDLTKNVFSNVVQTGFLEFGKAISLSKKCDLAVNPFVKNSACSVVNKVGDYAQAGLAVVNSQDCQEYIDILNDYNCGVSAKCEDYKDIAEKISYLYNNKELRLEMGKNNYKLFEEKFDRKNTYGEIVSCLLEK